MKKLSKIVLFFCLYNFVAVLGQLYAADATEYIKVFFNQPESASPSRSSIANPDKGIDDALVDFIQTAESGDKVYLCFYSSTTDKVTDAINSCAVKVGNGNIFHIMEEASGNSDNNAVDDPGIYNITNAIDDGYEAAGNPSLMHNKFAVVINTLSQTGRVWTGSYNPTSNGTFENNNNAVWIESYDLAKLYADEFIYMYNGGTGKFSSNKSTSSNTAKTVTVGEDTIEVYFSPYPGENSTNTSVKLEELIDNAQHSVFFCMFTFSDDETRLKNALIDAHGRGIEVKGIVEARQSYEIQSEFRTSSMDVVLDANESSLHHKFCIIDYGSDNPAVVTGSYNWTLSARDSNDENFLIIYSKEVSQLFWEEFQKDYALAGGVSSYGGNEAVSDVLVYPSPAKDADY
ncbi:phospholipase D-like domain-containing protein, partial [Elusimicrobiota bacterium]